MVSTADERGRELTGVDAADNAPPRADGSTATAGCGFPGAHSAAAATALPGARAADRSVLPDSIAAAWGVRERSHRGPKPTLSLERIVAAAVRVADADGLDAVSMGRVAAELGAAAMSLYRHVSAKEELLSLMVDAAWGDSPDPLADGEGWRSGLCRWAWAMRASIKRHPWAIRIPLDGL